MVHLFLHCPVALSLWHRLFVLRNVMWLAPKGSAHMLLIDFRVWEDRRRPKCFGFVPSLQLLGFVVGKKCTNFQR